MHPVGGMFVGRVESLIDEERAVQPVGLERGQSQRPVVLEAVCRLHPVQQIHAGRMVGVLIERNRPKPELVANEGGLQGVTVASHVDAGT